MSLSDIIGVAGLLVGLAAIPVTFILARRTRLRPQLRYVVDFDVILDPGDNLFDRGLYMTLGSRQIESISRTRIAIWNYKGDAIRKSDVLVSDPLRIQLTESDEVLQVRTLSVSRKQTGLTGQIDKEDLASVPISFEFLDASDGGVIEIIHKGPTKPSLKGILQGCDIRESGMVDLSIKALRAAAEKNSATAA